jgi:hypothetical protein
VWSSGYENENKSSTVGIPAQEEIAGLNRA